MFLNQHNAPYQFAPVWTVEAIQSCTGLIPSDFHMLHDATGTLVACGAIWDQRPVRQAVIRGYSSRLRRLRPLSTSPSVCSAGPESRKLAT